MSLRLRPHVDGQHSRSIRALLALALTAGACAPTPEERACFSIQYSKSDNVSAQTFEIDGVRNGVRIGTAANITIVSSIPNFVSGVDLIDVVRCTRNNVASCTQLPGRQIITTDMPVSRTSYGLGYTDHEVTLAPAANHLTPINGDEVDGVIISAHVSPSSGSSERHDCEPILMRFVR